MYENTILFVIVLAIFLGVIELVDIFRSYSHHDKITKRLSEQNKLKPDEEAHFISTVALGRTLMTFAIILVIGGALFFMLETLSMYLLPSPSSFGSLYAFCTTCTNSSNTANMTQILDILKSHQQTADEISKSLTEIIKSIATVLGGAVSAIVGFYFGSRAVESAKKAEEEKPEGAGPKGPKSDKGAGPGNQPSILISPVQVKEKSTAAIHVTGSSFAANSKIAIVVGATPLTVSQKSGEDGSFTTSLTLPTDIQPGDRMIIATDEENHSASARLTVTKA